MSDQVRNSDYGKSLNDVELSSLILKCAFKVHTKLGSGLLESVYRTCLAYELRKLGLIAIEELYFKVVYDNMIFDKGFRMDILVEDRYVLELKVVEKVNQNHRSTTLSYMKLAGVKRGLILNFAESSLKNGITRLVTKDNRNFSD